MSSINKIIAPSAMTNIEMMFNLNGTDKAPSKAFSFSNPETYNNVISLNVLDTQGKSHDFSTYFVKTNVVNDWNAYVFIDGRNIDTTEKTANFFPDKISFEGSVVLPKGEISANPFKLSFDAQGKLFNVKDAHGLEGFQLVPVPATDIPVLDQPVEAIIFSDSMALSETNLDSIPHVNWQPLHLTRFFFNQLDLSELNPALKNSTLDITVDFTDSTQFAIPFMLSDFKQTWRLTGTDENDTLSGSAGNDLLFGSMGKDKMTGGMGADTFIFYNVEETGITAKTRDVITDFKHYEGDKIDLSVMVSDEMLAFGGADVGFTFIGTKAFSKIDATAQVRFDEKSHILYGSTDADNSPEFSIQLNGVKSLVADDFIL